MHQNLTPHTWMHRHCHSSGQGTEILPLTHECTKIRISQVNAPESYPSHMNAPKWSRLNEMHRNLTPHTWRHWNHHSSGKYNRFLPLTHECIEIVTPQVNASKSYPSHMNAPKSSLLRWMHRNPTPHTWMHRNHHPSSKCIRFFPLTHESTEIDTQGKCTEILFLTHECTEIIIPQMNVPESYPSHMKASKSSSLK